MNNQYNGRKLNFKRIYSQIAKFGKLIPEMASEYDMDEETFRERLEKGLDTKLYATVIKADERNRKSRQTNTNNMTTTEEDTEMRKNNSMKQGEQSVKEPTIDELESKKIAMIGELAEKEKALNEAEEILAIREQAVADTESVFLKAKKALAEAQNEYEATNKVVLQFSMDLDTLHIKLTKVEEKITHLKNMAIYLVAPGYTGEKPAFGTFFSTVEVEGFEVSVAEVSGEYAIEPELKDMVVAGYDSYKEYMEGLRFVMLCVEYTCNDKKYTVLVSDERLKKLLSAHLE